MPFLFSTIETPRAISSLALSPGGYLAIGSEDGTCRFFHLPATKAYKAIRGLDDEISSLLLVTNGEPSNFSPSGAWVAFGREVALFDLATNSLVLTRKHATKIHNLLPPLNDAEDVLNEIALSSNFLAFSSDAGSVGVLDVTSGSITGMRTRHKSIAGCISFIPDRPKEVVSGGYDSTLIHHDFSVGSFLSRYDVSSMAAPSSGAANISLSPPFIICLSVSPSGIIAAGLADGRLWLGFGGEKSRPGSSKKPKKKRKYWEGLKASEESLCLSVADGPVVGIAFQDENVFSVVSLAGKLSKYVIGTDSGSGERHAEIVWTANTTKIAKTNALKTSSPDEGWIAVGGVGLDGRGYVEIWRDGDQSVSVEPS